MLAEKGLQNIGEILRQLRLISIYLQLLWPGQKMCFESAHFVTLLQLRLRDAAALR